MLVGKKKRDCPPAKGFTVLELVIALTVIGILAAISCPLYSNVYQECCVNAVMTDIINMVREVKMNALGGNYYAIAFDTTGGTMTMISGRGADGEWNTGDDEVARTIHLGGKGGVRFGYGDHGPLPDRADAPDGVSFPGNIYICNDRMTGNAGTVYIVSSSGVARAVVINSIYEGYVVWQWSGNEWVKN
jgi:prepilin-type N-terminal cleavage/methylation domain-containing protein